jgi:phosphate acetyltransferase
MSWLREQARSLPQRIVFPESSEEGIMRAACEIRDEGLGIPVLIGEPKTIEASVEDLGLHPGGLTFVDISDETTRAELVDLCLERFPRLSPQVAERKIRSPLNLGALLVAAGRADALVAGLTHATQDVILSAMTFIGMQEGIGTPSSIFLVRIPGFSGPEGELIVFADCGVTVAPDAVELAEIALTSAHTARTLLGWQPRVAMLSFSTKGSGEHESVDKVIEALGIARQRDPDLALDGEFQVDAAIVPSVAAKKVPDGSVVAGRANVLIFPDLNAGNIAYKCVQRFAQADAFGPFLQGFAKTVSDLSRGSSVADIVGVAVMAGVHAQGLKATRVAESSA